MSKDFLRFSVILTLAAVISLPGMASADYVQTWYENGLYADPVTHQTAYQTWDTAEAFLLSPGTWTGTGLTINSGTGWTATLINPQYARATSQTAYASKASEYFVFTTSATDLTTGTFSFDWVLSLRGAVVGVQQSIYTPGGGWTYTELTAYPPCENRSPVPLPPTLLLLGSGLVGLGLLRRRKLS